MSQCRIAFQLLAVLPTASEEAKQAAARTLMALQSSPTPAAGDGSSAPWASLIAEIVGTQLPWLDTVPRTAAAVTGASSSREATPLSSFTAQSAARTEAHTDARAARIVAGLLPTFRFSIAPEGKLPVGVTTRRGRGALYQHADCDDLPPCSELADPAVSKTDVVVVRCHN